MSGENQHTGLKWTIGILSFVIWVAVGRNVILSDGSGYDPVEGAWIMSTGQQWVMLIWTVAVIFGAVKIYHAIVKE